MVNVNNNFNVIPWYSSLTQQNHRKWYAFDKQWPLIMPSTRFLPFQFVLETAPTNISTITVYSESNKSTYDLGITPVVLPNTEKGYYVIMLHPGVCDLSTALPEGRYYATLTIDGEILYSEVFTIVSDISKYLKLTYWNADTLYYKNGEINYAHDFRYEMYLDATIGKPEYEFSEELTTRLGYKFLESQISNKLYKFIFLGPEFICDAMRLIRLSDYIKLESGQDSYNAISFSYEPNWELQGDLASIEVSFETDTIIQKLPSFNRSQRENFYNALLTSTAEPLLYDEGLIAQYYTAFNDAITGKLTRQLAEANVEEITEETVIPIDQGLGAAQQVRLLPLLRRYGGGGNSATGVVTIKVGDAIYQSSNGVVSLPAYLPLTGGTLSGPLSVTGDIISTGDQIAGSDIRYKTILSPFQLTVDQIASAPLFKFQWNNQNNKRHRIGTAAQYWEEIAPEFVTFDATSDFKHLAIPSLSLSIGISLAKEVQSLKQKVEALEEKLKRYE